MPKAPYIPIVSCRFSFIQNIFLTTLIKADAPEFDHLVDTETLHAIMGQGSSMMTATIFRTANIVRPAVKQHSRGRASLGGGTAIS